MLRKRMVCSFLLIGTMIVLSGCCSHHYCVGMNWLPLAVPIPEVEKCGKGCADLPRPSVEVEVWPIPRPRSY